MPRQPKPADLTILAQTGNDGIQSGPNTSPILQGVDLSSLGGSFGGQQSDTISTAAPGAAPSSSIAHGTSPPHNRASPPLSPRLFDRDHSRTFFGAFGKNKKAGAGEAEKDHRRPQAATAGQQEEDLRPGTSSMSKIYHLRKAPGSTPELSLVAGVDSLNKQQTSDATKSGSQELPPPPSSQSQSNDDSASIRKKDSGNKTFRNPLVRNKSVRRDSHSKSRPGKDSLEQPPMTAPLQSDWPGAEARMLGKGKDQVRRGKSAERTGLSRTDSEENISSSVAAGATSLQHKDSVASKASNSGSGGGFKTTSKNALSKAKTGGGNFLSRLGKIGRSGSNSLSDSREKEVPDNEYVFRVINLPLVEQTRITRISKHITACRDKTEFWMPSLPWRCIDYLNSKCEYEGLYRVPGSGPQVKRWQRRFDTELDVDLLKEDTYDVNEIASMLKAWLRELPTEIFPAAKQKALATQLEQENPRYKNVGEPAPQRLRDALSELPPFNYYLLFAITCHLSLILGHKEQNRMDLNNLAVCVGPCLYLDRWLFNYLVGDWRNCWRGCNTEKAAQEVEKRVAMGGLVAPSSSDLPSTDGTPTAAAVRQELRHEALLRGQPAYPPVLDDAASLDEPRPPLGATRSSSAASVSLSSRSGEQYHHLPPQHPSKSVAALLDPAIKPLTYIPAGAKVNSDGTLSGGASGLHIDFDAHHRRPSTSAGNNAPGQSEGGPNQRLSHRRSHGDLTNPLPGLPVRPLQ